jgi:hypothetical protein
MTGARRTVKKWRRVRWALWRVGWVLLLTAFWSSARFRLSTIWDLIVAIIVVAVFSVLIARVKLLYEFSKQASKRLWKQGQHEALRHLFRALSHLRD